MPPLLAAGYGAQALGNIVGGIGATQSLNQGLRDYRNSVNQGTNVLQQGREAGNAAYNPYTTTGAQGAQGELAAIQGRQQAQLPTLSNTSASGVQDWLSPQMRYTQGQAMKSAMAAGAAGGAMGGGMLKALQANSQKLAQGGWNDAYNQMLQANAQNFGQQQQNYANTTDFQQQQIGNLGNLANRGLSAVGQNQSQNLAYNQGINANYGDIANAAYSTGANKANIFGQTASGLGNIGKNFLGGLI